MAASVNDYFQKLGGASSLVNTPKVTATRAAAGTTLTVDNCNWDTTTGKRFATFQVDTSGAVVSGTEIIWKGVVSSTTSIGSLARVAGAADTGNAIGDYVMLLPASDWGNQMVTGLLVQHNQDGTHGAVTATSVSATGVINASAVSSLQDASVAMSTYRTDYAFDFVQSGLVWSGDSYASTRNASMTAGVVYINGQRGAVSAVTARTFTASKDTYIDILNTAGVFTVVYTEVANNAASPALAANSIRIGIIVTGASNIAAAGSVNQGQETMVLPIAASIPYAVTDSLGNLICPRDPNRRVLGYRQVVAAVTATTPTTATAVTGLTVPVIVPTGRKVKVSVDSGLGITNSGANASNFGVCLASAADANRIKQMNTPSTAGPTPVVTEVTTTPSTTSPTYVAHVRATTGNVTTNGDATSPAYIKVELV